MSDLPEGRVHDEVVQLHEERLDVRRRIRQTGAVRVAVRTRSRDQEVDEPLTRTEARVERVAIDRFVDEMPEVREEGDTTVIPVVEEILVRRILLKEEVRITRVATTRAHRETVALRRQDVVVSRTGPADPATGEVADTTPSTQGDTHGQ